MYACGMVVVACVAVTGIQVYLNRVRVADLPQTDKNEYQKCACEIG